VKRKVQYAVIVGNAPAVANAKKLTAKKLAEELLTAKKFEGKNR